MRMGSQESIEVFTSEIKRRYIRSFLDLLILQLVQTQPTWGYKIIKKTQDQYRVRLRHGALYPMLSTLEAKSLLQSKKHLQKGRIRKVYHITKKGKQFLQAYHDFLREQASMSNIKK
jgi:DNA-binding PadR family transcriptional regulator